MQGAGFQGSGVGREDGVQENVASDVFRKTSGSGFGRVDGVQGNVTFHEARHGRQVGEHLFVAGDQS